MMHPGTILLLLGLLLPFSASAAGFDDLPADNRIRVLTYSSGDIYTINTKYGYQTSIIFSPDEQISTISVGERTQWQIVPSGNRIFIRPMLDELATNMTVITNKREYNFDIKSVKGDNNLYVAQFRYPQEKPPEPAPDEYSASGYEAATPSPSNAVSIPPLDTQRTAELNMAYSYTGPDEIAPSQVYDDGRNTYVVYTNLPQDKPRPYIIGADGKKLPANHRIDGNRMIVVMMVSDIIILKNNQGEVTVYNESLKVRP